MNSLDDLLDVHQDIVPVIPTFPAQIRENTKMVSTHFDSQLPSRHAPVDVAANGALSHECPDEHSAHTVNDSHLPGVPAELTVSPHVVVSKW